MLANCCALYIVHQSRISLVVDVCVENLTKPFSYSPAGMYKHGHLLEKPRSSHACHVPSSLGSETVAVLGNGLMDWTRYPSVYGAIIVTSVKLS